MTDKKTKDTTDLSRRRFGLSVAGSAVAGFLAGFGGGELEARSSLDKKIRDLESDKIFDRGLVALHSFTNPAYVENLKPDDALNYLKGNIAVVKAGDFVSSGILIGPYVLCTHHGIKDIALTGKELGDVSKNEVVLIGENPFAFRFVASDEANDLALLSILGDYHIPPRIPNTSGELKIGKDVIVLGTTYPNPISYDIKGKITHVTPVKDVATGRIEQNKFVASTDPKEKREFGIDAVLADPNGSFLGFVQWNASPNSVVGVGMDAIVPFLYRAAAKESQSVLPYRKS